MLYDGFDTASANLGGGDDGKVEAPTQSSTQKTARHLIRLGRTACGVEYAVRGPEGLKLSKLGCSWVGEENQETEPATEMGEGRGARGDQIGEGRRPRCDRGGRGQRGKGQGALRCGRGVRGEG